MEGGVALTTLLMLLLLTPMAAGEKRGAITCTAVTTRSRTEVTCHFGQDISQSKHGFNVRFYYPDRSTLKYTPLMCNFLQDGGLLCQEGSDVIFNRMVSDQIQFISPAAVDKVGVQYVCQVAPHPPNTDIVPCNLTYRDDLPAFTRPTTTTPTQSLLLGEIRSLSLGTLAGIIVVLVVGFIVLLIYCCRHRIAEKVPVLAKVLGQGRGAQETHNVEEAKAGEEDDGQKPKKLFWGRLWSHLKEGNQAREEVPMLPSDKNEKVVWRSSSSQKEGKQTQEELPMLQPVINLKGKNRSDPDRQEPAASGIEAATMPLVMTSGRSLEDFSAENKPESLREREAREKKEQKEREQKEKEEKERKMKEEKYEKERKMREEKYEKEKKMREEKEEKERKMREEKEEKERKKREEKEEKERKKRESKQ